MNKLIENLKEIEKCNLKGSTMGIKKETLKKASWDNLQQMREAAEVKNEEEKQKYIECSQKIDEIEEQMQELQKSQQKNALRRACLENNIYLLIQNELYNSFVAEISKYKAIGEKTKEKIQNAIMEQFEQKYKGFYFQFYYYAETFISTTTYKLDINIYKNKTLEHSTYRGDFWGYTNKITDFEMSADSRPEKGLEPRFYNYEYTEINDINKKTADLLKERKHILEELEKANKKRRAYSDKLHNKLHSLLYIDVKY